jgi:uncharacterized membrane protein
MLLYTALALLVGWVLGMLGVFEVGKMVHIPLLIGLLLLLVAFLQARDAARNSSE